MFANSFAEMGLDSSLIRVYSVCQRFWRNGSGQQLDQGLQCLPTVLEKWSGQQSDQGLQCLPTVLEKWSGQQSDQGQQCLPTVLEK